MNRIIVHGSTIQANRNENDIAVTLHVNENTSRNLKERIFAAFLATVFSKANPYRCRLLTANVDAGYLTVMCDTLGHDDSISKSLEIFRDTVSRVYEE